MCSINHDLKCVFIHTPKCGGLHVQKVLEMFYGFQTCYFTHENHDLFVDEGDLAQPLTRHGLLCMRKGGVLKYCMTSDVHNQATHMTPDKWSTYTIMAVRRNPYDRFVSACHYVSNHRKVPCDIQAFAHEKAFEDVDAWEYFHLFMTQYSHLLTPEGALGVDVWLSFESLNADLCYALLNMGVPKIKHRELLLDNVKMNATQHEPYYTCYTPETIQFVNTFFADDFEHLNYEPVQDVAELKKQSVNYYVPPDVFNKQNVKLVIELDQTESIIQFDDDFYERVSKRAKRAHAAPPPEQNGDSIVLPNGVVLNTKQAPREETHAPPDHYSNLLSLIRKMANK